MFLKKIQKQQFCCILFLFAIINTSNGQQTFDSLETKNHKELLKLYGKSFRKQDTIKTKKIAKAYLSQAKINIDTSQIVTGYLLHSFTTSFSTKLMYYDSIISITKNNQSKKYPAYTYYLKAQFYFYKKRNIDEAIKNTKLARKYAVANNNTDLLYRLDYLIGVIKSEHLGEKKEAITIFKKCYNYYNQRSDIKHIYRYLYTNHMIAETYIGIQKHDSATYYNKIGYDKAKANRKTDPIIGKMKSMFTNNEGINQFYLKNYQKTIDSITTALPDIIDITEIPSIINSYFYLGQSYFKIKKKDSAIHYFKKTDSVLQTQKSIPQYKHVKTYEYLKNYYKEQGDHHSHNAYLTKLNTTLAHYIDDKIHIGTQVKKDYDIPVLLDEQRNAINKLNKTNNSYGQGILVLLLLLGITASIIFYQYRKRQYYLKRFKELMEAQNNITKKETLPQKSDTTTITTLDVPEQQVLFILEKLDNFEKEKGYLSQGLTSKSLASQMDTNVRYLSKVINHYKNKTFIIYLNELRITYIVHELKTNTTLQKYTIKAIAEEIGYNNSETFSKAFHMQTGIKPSYFIKQLKKIKPSIAA